MFCGLDGLGLTAAGQRVEPASTARELGAETLWFQSGRASDGSESPEGTRVSDTEAARIQEIAAAAGLTTVHGAYVSHQVARELGEHR